MFQHALAASETITGLIVATALVIPRQETYQCETQIGGEAHEGKGFRGFSEPG